MRALDPRRDLRAVADLIEESFSGTLDGEARRYLQSMRRAASNPGFLRWASGVTEWAGLPLNGYVWEEDGQILGNISLIPNFQRGRRFYLIANVAVHPQFRRRGIARNLTLQAIAHARQKNASSVWLHVRDDNPAALTLYSELDFEERTRRTTWQTGADVPLAAPRSSLQIRPRQSGDWESQRVWLAQAYPRELAWHLPVRLNALRPGIFGWLYRAFTNTNVWQWSVWEGGRLAGVLAWQPTYSYADHIHLALSQHSEDDAAYALLVHAQSHLSPRRPLNLDFPAGRAAQGIAAAGFIAHHTLIWMEKSFQ